MTKAVFWDVDDTLYDHLLPFRKAVMAWVGEEDGFPYEEAYHRLRYYSDMLSRELGGASAMGSGDAVERMRRRRFQLALAEYGIGLSEEEAAAVQSAYIGCQYDIDMFPGAAAIMRKLQEDGYTVGLITNGEGGHQRRKIEALGATELIDPQLVFISGEIGWDKPDSRIFRHVNDSTGTEPSGCVYIGDSWRNDVIGALEAGWTAVWFNHRRAEAESEHRPQHVAHSCEELCAVLERLIR